ncbi:hypothetical protein [Scytonema sp. HK-05]|uniref:hypothetical protein n=1 Tax=Scytonema sp. HK-05 TaxID=1137095 RepID=UPI00130134B8|nr:hypothetical protein [Scytonema sp. HK-05]
MTDDGEHKVGDRRRRALRANALWARSARSRGAQCPRAQSLFGAQALPIAR